MKEVKNHTDYNPNYPLHNAKLKNSYCLRMSKIKSKTSPIFYSY